MSAVDFKHIEERVGRIHMMQRLGIQTDHVNDQIGQGYAYINFENIGWMYKLLEIILHGTFLYKRGQRNAVDMQVTHHDIPLPHLPDAFDGYTILHLSDLHLDYKPAIYEALIKRLGDVVYDLCVITGDYRRSTFGPFEACMEIMTEVRKHIRDPVYGILGNHDFIEMLDLFETMDLPILMNETVPIERDGDVIYLVGVDDPHFYLADNLEKALADVPPEAVKILLSHSPELYQEAAYSGCDVMFSGHTHGGQVCLPGGKPVIVNARCPRTLCSGPWRFKQMTGYTSRGIGSSGLDVRFNCPPELVLHRLKKVHSEEYRVNSTE